MELGRETRPRTCLVDEKLAGEDELLARRLNGGPGTREGVEAHFRHCREQWDTAWPLRGLATRAVLLASQYAARVGGAQAVIQVEPENSASAAVALRAGFTPGSPTHGKDGTRFDRYVRDLHTTAL
ncbi:GNAT family N-acetyltransferase [Streptomyces drozdowiczii]